MDRITKYVFRQLAVGLVLVTAGLACIIWLFYSLHFVEMIVNRGVSTGLFVYLTVLSLPNFLATPHIGGSAEEARLAMGRAAIRGLFDNAVPEPGQPPFD